MIDTGHSLLISRLSVIGRPAGQCILDAVDAWNDLPLERRARQTKRTRCGCIYDDAYGILKDSPTPIFDVHGREHEKYAEICDGGSPLAFWIKAVRRRTLHTANNWTSPRTRRVRLEGRLNDRPGRPAFVYLVYTSMFDPVLHTLAVEDMYFTREENITADHRVRSVRTIMHVYNFAMKWLMTDPAAAQLQLFTPATEAETPGFSVRLRPQVPAASADTPVVGPEAAKKAAEQKAAEEAAKAKNDKRAGA